MEDLTIDDLSSKNNIWFADIGRGNYELTKWDNFLKPTKMKIIDSYKRSIEYEYVYVIIKVDKWKDDIVFRLDGNKVVNNQTFNIFGMNESDVTDIWLMDIKRQLLDSWSGVNKISSKDVFKQYLIDNEFEYFIKKYPELIV